MDTVNNVKSSRRRISTTVAGLTGLLFLAGCATNAPQDTWQASILSFALFVSSILRAVLRFEDAVEVSPLLDLLLLCGLELDSLDRSCGLELDSLDRSCDLEFDSLDRSGDWVRVNPGVSSINIL
jgi:hypothetical protein